MINRSLFTSDFITNIIVDMFRKADEDIEIIEEGVQKPRITSLMDYLDIQFYSWQNRVEEANARGFEDPDSWVEMLRKSLTKSYALVELQDEKVRVSADIDNAVKDGNITFLVQADKIKNLDYMVAKVRNTLMGRPFTIQNSYGDKVKAYMLMGTLLYDEEPESMQAGYCLVASVNFTMTYMTEASSYDDIKVELSLDGGKHYYEAPFTEETWQVLTSSAPVPFENRPDLLGFLPQTQSRMATLTFYDFNKDLTNAINKAFWEASVLVKNGIVQSTKKEVAIPVALRVIYNNEVYEYNTFIDNMQKVITNGSYNTTSLTLKNISREPKYKVLYFDKTDIYLTETYTPSIDGIMYVTSMPPHSMSNVVTNTLEGINGVATLHYRAMFYAKADSDVSLECTLNAHATSSTGGVDVTTISNKVFELKKGEITPIILDTDIIHDGIVNNVQFRVAITNGNDNDVSVEVIADDIRAFSLYVFE